MATKSDERKTIVTSVPMWVSDSIRALAKDEKRSFTKQLEIIVIEWVEDNL